MLWVQFLPRALIIISIQRLFLVETSTELLLTQSVTGLHIICGARANFCLMMTHNA